MIFIAILCALLSSFLLGLLALAVASQWPLQSLRHLSYTFILFGFLVVACTLGLLGLVKALV